MISMLRYANAEIFSPPSKGIECTSQADKITIRTGIQIEYARSDSSEIMDTKQALAAQIPNVIISAAENSLVFKRSRKAAPQTE